MGPGGAVFAGCNVENAAYPAGTCAEEAAIAAMVAAGERRIAAVLVFGAGEALTTPCGACRQRIREFAPPERFDPYRGSGRDPAQLPPRRAVAGLLRTGESGAP